MERNRILDILKGFGIFFVVFGHIVHIGEFRTYIWGFHMPLFFLISGLLYNNEKYKNNFILLFKSRFASLALPYVLFYIITFLYWVVIERHVRGGNLSVCSQIMGLFYGTYNLNYNYFNGTLWFLPCLFSVEMLFWIISKVKKNAVRVIIAFLLYVIGVISKDYLSVLPFGICQAFIVMIYFTIGNVIKNDLKFLYGRDISRLFVIIVIICLLISQIYLLPVTGADLAFLNFKNYITYIPISLIGIAFYYLVSSLIRTCNVMEFIGKNSLVIFCLQEPVYRAVIFLFSKVVNENCEMVRENLLLAITCTIVSILIIIPVILIFNRYCKPYFKKVCLN